MASKEVEYLRNRKGQKIEFQDRELRKMISDYQAEAADLREKYNLILEKAAAAVEAAESAEEDAHDLAEAMETVQQVHNEYASYVAMIEAQNRSITDQITQQTTDKVAAQVAAMQVREGQTVIDATLTTEGAAADAKTTGERIVDLKEAVIEETRNLNTAKVGQYATNTSGVINEGTNGKNFGISEKLPCYPNTAYTISAIGITASAPNVYVTYYDASGEFISRGLAGSAAGYVITITTPESAYFMHIAFYKSEGITISENAKMQIELGTEKTDYVEPYMIKGLVDLENSVKDVKADVRETNERIDGLSNKKSRTKVPEDFGWNDNPLLGKINNSYKGEVDVDFDISEYDPSSDGVTYYVDCVNGSDSNNGLTESAPLGTMAAAYDKSDVSCIMLKAGHYIATRNLSSKVITKTIAIKGMPGEEVFIEQTSTTVLSADEEHEGVYTGSRGNCFGILDQYVENEDGDGTLYDQVNSINEVYENEGTWILSGGILYVHTINGRVPDDELRLFRSGNNLVIEGDCSVYLENLKVYGGNSPLRATAQNQSDKLNVYAKDCDFYYTYSVENDCVMMQGTTLSVFENCKAKYSQKDGFNYHTHNGIIPKAIELDCVGAFCGNSDDNNDQGSTIHDGGSAIRVNCIYHDNYGSNVADQGEGSESWNIGCIAYDSKATFGQNSNYFAYSGVKMFLESCVGFGSTNNIYKHDDTSKVALRNCNFEGKLAPTGQTIEYY